VKPRLLKAAIVLATAAVVGGLVAGPAGATPPSGYGFDDTSHIIVGGGSDTTYFTMQLLATDWGHSDFGNTGGCTINTTAGAALNECLSNANPETNDLGNYQHDSITQANPVGSSSGIASLNALPSGTTYGGTANNNNVDFARSSRGPKTSGSSACSGGNELTCDTFWGFGQDGVQVTVFGSRVTDFLNAEGNTPHPLQPVDLYHIFNCDYSMWDQVPGLGISPGASNDGPIVPWGMNTASGTEATFQTYLQGAGSNPAFNVDSPTGTTNTGVGPIDSYTHKVGCARELSNGSFPFENDMKPLVNDPANLSTNAQSVDDPVNWITWSSFGVMSSFPFLSQPTRTASGSGQGTQYTTGQASINGVTASARNVGNNTWAIGRTLYHVTRKSDADCPLTSGTCDFVGNPGPTSNTTGLTDLNVVGGTSGVSGAVREFTRFLCRPSTGGAGQQSDPFTGVNYDTEITGALASSGFTTVPGALVTSGTRCRVQH
jgi:ABC-type phosphate transport system substrate-binding protein